MNSATSRWSIEQAQAWDREQPWLVGCNFVPSYAINQLEMWQEETFDLHTIDRELGWLEALGMNTVRVYLHDLLWQQNSPSFLSRIDRFLGVCQNHGIRVMLVLYDSCGNSNPQSGPQPQPRQGVHNSHWLKSPATKLLLQNADFDRLKTYVTEIIEHFRDDSRVIIWDLWNEPDNLAMHASKTQKLEMTPAELVRPLLAKVFAWAREVNPTQPLTAGVWQEKYREQPSVEALHRFQVSASDIISFHAYHALAVVKEVISDLEQEKRPLICTEYMARTRGSTFQAILPYFKQKRIHAYSWGAVSGKTQTIYPWDSEQQRAGSPFIWFHDIFHPDGNPYSQEECGLIQSLTNSAVKKKDSYSSTQTTH